jgi:hypothetical protein
VSPDHGSEDLRRNFCNVKGKGMTMIMERSKRRSVPLVAEESKICNLARLRLFIRDAEQSMRRHHYGDKLGKGNRQINESHQKYNQKNTPF